MKQSLLAILALLWLLGRPHSVCAAPVSLPLPHSEAGTPNPDDPAASRDVPTWQSHGVIASYTFDPDVRRSGDASFHITNQGRPNAPVGAAQSALFILTGQAVPGLTYRVTGFIKTLGLENEAGFHVRFRSPDGWLDVDTACDTVRDDQDWGPISARFTAPSGATEFDLFLIVRGRGEAWFDELEAQDDFETWAAQRFSGLRDALAGLVAEGRASEPPLPREELDLLAAGVARAEDLIARTQAIKPGDNVPVEQQRRFAEAANELDALVRRPARALSVLQTLEMARAAGVATAPFVIGFAPSTVHVFLEDLPLDVEITPEQSLFAVRGETEAVQLVILAHPNDLTGVRVTASVLTGSAGVIPAESVVVKPVGFVQTRKLDGQHPYRREHEYTGWWPDPLLPNFAFDVAAGTTQPVWIEIRVPREIQAGEYRGTIRVATAEATRSVALAVEVADVTLPRTWHFRNLLSFHEQWNKDLYGEAWDETLRESFIQFLLARRLNVISMYGNEPYETPENLIRFAAEGQNVLMTAWLHPEARVKASKAAGLRARLDAMLPPLREVGVLDRCIVYGWDERGPEYFDEVRYGAEVLARDYDGLPLLSAGTDVTYGTASSLSGLSNIIYCPTMPMYDPQVAAQARANGNAVWWYEIWWIIEDPLIRSRLIPWQTFKVNADGFLFWCLNRWSGNDTPVFDPAQPRIRTDWNPALDGGYFHSSAMYLYPGSDGPVSSLRLENFRDGIEDYDMLMLARGLLASLQNEESADPALLEQLREATTIEDSFIKDHADYSRDPVQLQAHRQALIKAIEAARHARE